MYTRYTLNKYKGNLKLKLRLSLDANVSHLLHEVNNSIKWGFNDTVWFAIPGIEFLHIFP